MKILITPDSFKESLSASEAAEAMARGVQSVLPDTQIDLCPMADGGEGTVEALVNATDGQFFATQVTGPLGEPVDAIWGELGQQSDNKKTAVIEMAAAAGLALVPPEKRDPTQTTTFGVGQLIKTAIDYGNKQIILGIGGSATTDGGTGCAQALGIEFIDHYKETITDCMTGSLLPKLTHIDLSIIDPRLWEIDIRVACDVTNPLLGDEGAAAVYAPQKGATSQQVEQLEKNLEHLAKIVYNAEPDEPGMGAAGGLGFGLVHFLNAKLERGIDLILDATSFDQRVQQADLVITGEGKLDGQSRHGKTCLGIAQRAMKYNVPTIALVGIATEDAPITLQYGLKAYHAIVNEQVTQADAMNNAATHLQKLAATVIGEYL